MCGFVGYFGTGNYERKMILNKMSETICHRGPDSKGEFIDDYVALGFRRLSIIDLEGGTQPILNSDYVIIFNGEIYNYKNIRKDLIENYNIDFKTNSDTEVILNGYIVFKEKIVEKLRGMFSFVIYNKNTHEIFGARDYFGIKPFYYCKTKSSLLFSSEIKSFLEHPDFKKEINKDALKLYLIFQYVPTKETIFKNVFKLNPGEYFKYSGNEIETFKYFEPSYKEMKLKYSETMKLIGDTIEKSVEHHQISDVEVGSFLSGGVDSSYIASLVKPMKTYSVGFNIDGFDETVYAKDLCKILKMSNEQKMISPDDFFDALPNVQYYSDEPHANLSAVPLYYLAKLASKDVKVVLSGEGADELFGGYETYLESNIANLYKKIFPYKFRNKLANTIKGNFKGANFIKRNGKKLEDSYIGQAFIMDNEEALYVLKDKYKTNIRYQDITRPYFDEVVDQDDLHKKLYLDMKLWLPHDILLKADKMTMAHSLELRVPYLDKEVFSVARALKSKYMVKEKTSKKIFRESALKKIPTDWAKRKKLGFMVPFRVWIKEEKYYNKVLEVFSSNEASEFFNSSILIKWLQDHRASKGVHHRKIYTVWTYTKKEDKCGIIVDSKKRRKLNGK